MNSSEWPYRNVHEYLQASGILQSGSKQDIEDCKKSYWREYRRRYQNKHRKEFPEFTIRFKHTHAVQIRKLAQNYDISAQQFIKEVMLDSLDNPVERKSAITESALQKISLIHSDISNYVRNSSKLKSEKLYQHLLNRIEALESLIEQEVWS